MIESGWPLEEIQNNKWVPGRLALRDVLSSGEEVSARREAPCSGIILGVDGGQASVFEKTTPVWLAFATGCIWRSALVSRYHVIHRGK